ncbi:MAG: glycosyltransferase [Desulfobulbus sp.]|nr:glycosyltransferase [Desulfobulbus sp.]
MIAVSVVSHGHGEMVANLVVSLLSFPEVCRILVTLNRPESLQLPGDERISVIHNALPKGFGANHNTAFSFCNEPFFCVVNPDIELRANPFPALLEASAKAASAVTAPMVLSPQGTVEDSFRRFPNLRRLIVRLFGQADRSYASIPIDRGIFFPEWVAGMFMLFSSEDFAALNGFDEKFFLYYEDVDICVRAWKSGRKVAFCPEASVVHDARRSSHRDMRFLRWHLASMMRYFYKHWARLPEVLARTDW